MLQVLPAPPQPTGLADIGSVLMQAGQDYQNSAIRREDEANKEKLEQARLQNQLKLQQASDTSAMARTKVEMSMRLDAENKMADLNERRQILRNLVDKGYLKETDLQGDPSQITAAITSASIRYQQDQDRGRDNARSSLTNAQGSLDQLVQRTHQLESLHNSLIMQEATPAAVTPDPDAIKTRATDLATLQLQQQHHLYGTGMFYSNVPSQQDIANQIPAAQQELSQQLAASNAERSRARKVLLDTSGKSLADNKDRIKEIESTFHIAPSAAAFTQSPPADSADQSNLTLTSDHGAQKPTPPPVVLRPGGGISSFLSNQTGTNPPPGGDNAVVSPSLQQLPASGATGTAAQLIAKENQRRAAVAYQSPIDAINSQLSDLDAQEQQLVKRAPTLQTNPWGAFQPGMVGVSSVPAPTDDPGQAAQLSAIQQRRQMLQQQLNSLQNTVPQQNVNPMPPLPPTPAQPASQSNLVYATPGDNYAPPSAY